MSALPDTVLREFARQILNATRVVTNAPEVGPGEPVTIDVVSGLVPQLPASSQLGHVAEGLVSDGLDLTVPDASDQIRHISVALPAITLGGLLSAPAQTLELAGTLAAQTLDQSLTAPARDLKMNGKLAQGPTPNAPTQALDLGGTLPGEELSGTISGPAQAVELMGTLSELVQEVSLAGPDQQIGLDLPAVPRQLVSGVLTTLAGSVELHVTYEVKDAERGAAVAPTDYSKTQRSSPLPVEGSDALNVAFLLKPPIGDDTAFIPPRRYVIEVTLRVAVKDPTAGVAPEPAVGTASQTVSVPVTVPALEIPALLLMGKHANFETYDSDPPEAGYLIVMVRAGSPISTLSILVATLKRLLALIRTLQQVLGWGTNTAFTQGLQHVLQAVANAPTVYFVSGNSPDVAGQLMSVSSLLLVGVAGTKVTAYGHWEYNSGVYGTFDAQQSVITAEPVMIGSLSTGVGVSAERWRNLSAVNWDTADRHMNDQVHSVRFGSVATVPTPRPGLSVTVTPTTIAFNQLVETLSVQVTDRATGQPVPEVSVTVRNFDERGRALPTITLAPGSETPHPTTFSASGITFNPGLALDPRRRTLRPISPPVGIVRAPGYVSAYVPFDFPDMPEDLGLDRGEWRRRREPVLEP